MTSSIPSTKLWLPLLAGLCAQLSSAASAAEAQPGRPNIILLESDDHHYLALGCLGDPVKTPNIDRRAACCSATMSARAPPARLRAIPCSPDRIRTTPACITIRTAT